MKVEHVAEVMSDGSVAHNVEVSGLSDEAASRVIKFACPSKEAARKLIRCLNECSYIEILWRS